MSSKTNVFTIACRGMLLNRKRSKLWNLILGCVIWSLWYKRNKVKFENKTLDPHNLFQTLKIRVGIWAMEILDLDVVQSLVISHNIDAILR